MAVSEEVSVSGKEFALYSLFYQNFFNIFRASNVGPCGEMPQVFAEGRKFQQKMKLRVCFPSLAERHGGHGPLFLLGFQMSQNSPSGAINRTYAELARSYAIRKPKNIIICPVIHNAAGRSFGGIYPIPVGSPTNLETVILTIQPCHPPASEGGERRFH